MSKLKLMEYDVVSEMVSIGVTPEEYLPRINSLTAPAILIGELMHIGVESDFVIEDGDSFMLRCPEYSEHYNDFLEVFIQSFRYKSRRVQNIIESYKILSKRELKSVPISSHLVDQNTELRKEVEKLREEAVGYSNTITAMNSTISGLQDDLEVHIQIIEDLKLDLASLTDARTATDLLNQLKIENADLADENSQLKHDLDSLTSEAAEEQEVSTRYKSEVSDNLTYTAYKKS